MQRNLSECCLNIQMGLAKLGFFTLENRAIDFIQIQMKIAKHIDKFDWYFTMTLS